MGPDLSSSKLAATSPAVHVHRVGDLVRFRNGGDGVVLMVVSVQHGQGPGDEDFVELEYNLNGHTRNVGIVASAVVPAEESLPCP